MKHKKTVFIVSSVEIHYIHDITSLFEKMITNEMITISNLSNISFQKWNDIDFGLVLRDSSGKGCATCL